MIAVEDMPFSSVICTCMLVQANAATFTQHVKACARATGNKAKPHVVFSHAGGMLLACVTLAGVLKWREEAGTPLEQLRVTAFDHAYNASTEGPETAARRLMQHFNVQIHWTFCSTEEQMCRMSRTHPFDVLLQQDIDIRTRSGGCKDNSTALATVRCRCTKIITQRTRVLVWDAVGLDGALVYSVNPARRHAYHYEFDAEPEDCDHCVQENRRYNEWVCQAMPAFGIVHEHSEDQTCPKVPQHQEAAKESSNPWSNIAIWVLLGSVLLTVVVLFVVAWRAQHVSLSAGQGSPMTATASTQHLPRALSSSTS